MQFSIKPKALPPELVWIFNTLPISATFRWFVAGGAVRSIIDKTPVSDIDLFSRSDKQGTDDLDYLLIAAGCRKTFVCPQGSLTSYKHRSGLKIQAILAVTGHPDSIIDQFDFTACQFAMQSPTSFHSVSRQNIWDAARKILKFTHVSYPHATIRRIGKYLAKGYTLSPEEAHKFISQSSAIPFDGNSGRWRAYID